MSKIIVVKMGSVASDNLTDTFFKQITQWKYQGYKIVIIHGGGHYITEMMHYLEIPVVIKEGLRVTNEQTLKITQMVLIGQVQPMITTRFLQEGFSAVGLNASSGQIITGSFLNKKLLGFVGEVENVHTELLVHLFQKDYIPIIAPLGLSENGEWLNINADHIACKVAEELEAEALYLLTDVPGVKHGNRWLNQLFPKEISELKKAEVIKGGMLPKVDSALIAINKGVKEVHITDELTHAGTVIKLEEVIA